MSLTQEQRQQLRNKYIGASNASEQPTNKGLTTEQKVGEFTYGAASGLIEGARGVAQILQGGGQRVLAGLDPTRSLEDIRKETGFKSLDNRSKEGALLNEQLRAKNNYQLAGKAAQFAGDVAFGTIATKGDDVLRAISRGIKGVGDEAAEKVSRFTPDINDTSGGIIDGVGDLVQATGRTFKRGIENVGDNLVERGRQAKEIAELPEAASNAVRTGFDLNSVRRIQQADPTTIKGYKEMVERAKNAEMTRIPTDHPKFFAGERFVDQFQLLENQRRAVGKKLGEEVAKLGDNYSIGLEDDIVGLKNRWVTNKVSTGLTKKQRSAFDNALKELESNSAPTASELRLLDQKMSRLQRELGADGIADLNYTDSAGNLRNVYDDIRSIYTKRLEAINPEIRKLNRQYRPLAETKKQVLKDLLKYDPKRISDDVPIEELSEEAALNLQRIMGNSQTGPKIRRLINLVNDRARALGYNDINPDEAAIFARELEDLYDITPKTSLRGNVEGGVERGVTGVRDAIGQAIGKVVELGSPTDANKQRALEKLLDDILNESTKTNKPLKEATRGGEEAFGVVAGFQEDENGKIIVDPVSAALGAVGIGSVKAINPNKFKTISKKIDVFDKKLMADYIDSIRIKKPLSPGKIDETVRMAENMGLKNLNTQQLIEAFERVMGTK